LLPMNEIVGHQMSPFLLGVVESLLQVRKRRWEEKGTKRRRLVSVLYKGLFEPKAHGGKFYCFGQSTMHVLY